MKTSSTKDAILNKLAELNININVLNFKTLNSRDRNLANEILSLTSFLPDTAKLRERIYCIEHDITVQQICPQCIEADNH